MAEEEAGEVSTNHWYKRYGNFYARIDMYEHLNLILILRNDPCIPVSVENTLLRDRDFIFEEIERLAKPCEETE
jgi:hypothetical protein